MKPAVPNMSELVSECSHLKAHSSEPNMSQVKQYHRRAPLPVERASYSLMSSVSHIFHHTSHNVLLTPT